MINIIGGSGFIGSRLASKYFRNGVEHKVLDIKESENQSNYVFADVTDIETLRNNIQEESLIINLAAEHKDNIKPISKYYDVNVKGAKNVCEIAEEKQIKKIIFTSSVAVYGFADQETDESGHINPFNDYGKSKFEAEKIYMQWQKKDKENRTLIIIRPTVVFGEKNRGNVFNLLYQINSRNFFKIGSGNNKKSIAYVDNVVDFIDFCLKIEKNITISNYIDKPDLSMNELVDHTKNLLGYKNKLNISIPYYVAILIGMFFDLLSFLTRKEFSISMIRIKKFCSSTTFTSNKEDIGFKPKIDIYEGLNKTITHEFIKQID